MRERLLELMRDKDAGCATGRLSLWQGQPPTRKRGSDCLDIMSQDDDDEYIRRAILNALRLEKRRRELGDQS